MKRFRNLLILLATFISAVILFGSTDTTASASPTTPANLPSSATTAVRAPVTNSDTGKTYTPEDTRGNGPATAATGDPQVASYWTPERMKNAIPLDTPPSTSEVNDQIGKLQQPSVAEPLTVGSTPVAAA